MISTRNVESDEISVEPKISDLGLSRNINISTENKELLGVVSFSAPLGNQPTKESEIYSWV
ncbi:8971_t:CDS:2 [Gigaspora margarita]|uniref:8971_t:CDS:1 n=1 Tax=Gigaspora margarita TaxID=4874 RepID=A0ABN7VJP3_GIGMA|nr:8971_t:CDS:2 [Gigaspora margarita]